MKIIIIDNYDSFTFNLLHYVEEFVEQVDVFRNDKISLKKIEKYDKIILSPGPGLPKDVPILHQIIKTYYKEKAILGICLGHQAIAESFGGSLFNLSKVVHGLARNTIITKKNEKLFQNIPNNFNSGRYHSWAVCKNNFPKTLEITAIDNENLIMALSHKKYKVKGVQFHPESIMTNYGKEIINNFLKLS